MERTWDKCPYCGREMIYEMAPESVVNKIAGTMTTILECRICKVSIMHVFHKSEGPERVLSRRAEGSN